MKSKYNGKIVKKRSDSNTKPKQGLGSTELNKGKQDVLIPFQNKTPRKGDVALPRVVKNADLMEEIGESEHVKNI